MSTTTRDNTGSGANLKEGPTTKNQPLQDVTSNLESSDEALRRLVRETWRTANGAREAVAERRFVDWVIERFAYDDLFVARPPAGGEGLTAVQTGDYGVALYRLRELASQALSELDLRDDFLALWRQALNAFRQEGLLGERLVDAVLYPMAVLPLACGDGLRGLLQRCRNALLSDPARGLAINFYKSWAGIADLAGRAGGTVCSQFSILVYEEAMADLLRQDTLPAEAPAYLKSNINSLVGRLELLNRVRKDTLSREQAELLNRLHACSAAIQEKGALPRLPGEDLWGLGGDPEKRAIYAKLISSMFNVSGAWRSGCGQWGWEEEETSSQRALLLQAVAAGYRALLQEETDRVTSVLFNTGVRMISEGLSGEVRVLVNGLGLALALLDSADITRALGENDGFDLGVNLFGALTELDQRMRPLADIRTLSLALLLYGGHLPAPRDEDGVRLFNSLKELGIEDISHDREPRQEEMLAALKSLLLALPGITDERKATLETFWQADPEQRAVILNTLLVGLLRDHIPEPEWTDHMNAIRSLLDQVAALDGLAEARRLFDAHRDQGIAVAVGVLTAEQRQALLAEAEAAGDDLVGGLARLQTAELFGR
ncbi:hypothetical protein [Sedimenticola hydrogenitrophicus]|uniref:hypothetical protein n=1 Tax=Sedimenticola hydrogenitrophicus TaxID=2967975 RepID=UPI0021A4B83E|nr:hypothetical protein [Sedimenticola hydrogenitrophicus]